MHVPRNRIGDSYAIKLQEGAKQVRYELMFQERQENVYTGWRSWDRPGATPPACMRKLSMR